MKNNKIIKNLKVRSIALTLATITGLSLVGCTEKVEAEDIAPTQTATIEVMETPKTTPLPTIEPTPTITVEPTMEPTATPRIITMSDIDAMAEKIYEDNLGFFSTDLSFNFPFTGFNITSYTKEDIINIILYLNNYEPMYATENTYVDGIYDANDVVKFKTFWGSYFYFYANSSVDEYMLASQFFFEGTYDYEIFKMIDDKFIQALSGNTSQEETNEVLGLSLKILVDEPVNGEIVTENLQNDVSNYWMVSSIGYFLDGYVAVTDQDLSEIFVPLKYIFEYLENDSKGDYEFPISGLVPSSLEVPYGVEEEFDKLSGCIKILLNQYEQQCADYTLEEPYKRILD